MEASQRVWNVNVGVLGHVDSGKTALGKLLILQAPDPRALTTLPSQPIPTILCSQLLSGATSSGRPVDEALHGSSGQAPPEQGARHHPRPRLLLLHGEDQCPPLNAIHASRARRSTGTASMESDSCCFTFG